LPQARARVSYIDFDHGRRQAKAWFHPTSANFGSLIKRSDRSASNLTFARLIKVPARWLAAFSQTAGNRVKDPVQQTMERRFLIGQNGGTEGAGFCFKPSCWTKQAPPFRR